MVYHFNLGIGWASSGVEYAQSYRAKLLRAANIPSKFVFTDMFPTENIEHMTKNIGFLDEEILWLYTAFTDTKISPVTYTLDDLEKTLPPKPYTFQRNGKVCKYLFAQDNVYYTVYMVNEESPYVHRVEFVSNGCLIKKDYYTYCKIYTEYYAPLEHKAHLYARTFFNEDGTLAYEEIIDDKKVFYRVKNEVFYSKAALVAAFVRTLHLTEKDTILIDRTTGIGQAILENAGPAKVGIIIHADHFSEGATTKEHILWNNYYEYAFAQRKHIDFFVTACEAQKELLCDQFLQYYGEKPNVVTIPVGSIDHLQYPTNPRKKHALLTASRLANEKHCDWLIKAVAKARESIPDLSLDIYGKGEEEGKLSELIASLHASDYIHLMGQQDLTDVYVNYEAYLCASQSEGFGLTLLEALGSGLPIIGFDVRYGMQTFVEHGKNGYRIPMTEEMDQKEKINLLARHILLLYEEDRVQEFSEKSYEKAERYESREVMKKWITLLT